MLDSRKSELLKEYESLLVGHWLSDLSNTSAFIYHELPDILWAGFYLLEDGQLRLGPFQGKPACTNIQLGRGVCGKVAKTLKPELVEDVHLFSDHIVCDARANSELVIPIVSSILIGVLDIDSEKKSRFQQADQSFAESLVRILLAKNPGI